MNLNYLFNVDYYSEFTYSYFKSCNHQIANQKWQVSDLEPIYFTEYSFPLKTIYPGLLIGLGNAHSAGTDFISGDSKSGTEIKLGFTLDFVTGLPVIPGSTIKGVLRSAFKNFPEYIAEKLCFEEKKIKDIENDIFGKDDMGKVIFFDAIPIKPNKDGRLLGLESITPHNKPYDADKSDGGEEYQMNGLKNPIPLTMLKVIPGVSFLFRFGFDSFNDVNISNEQLKNAFKSILIDLGIGAKTNVGFGVLENDDTEISQIKLKQLIAVQSERKVPMQTQTEVGYCKALDCNERTNKKKDGSGYHPYCQKHFLENQRKRGIQ